jgi:hypothetical protein
MAPELELLHRWAGIEPGAADIGTVEVGEDEKVRERAPTAPAARMEEGSSEIDKAKQ